MTVYPITYHFKKQTHAVNRLEFAASKRHVHRLLQRLIQGAERCRNESAVDFSDLTLESLNADQPSSQCLCTLRSPDHTAHCNYMDL